MKSEQLGISGPEETRALRLASEALALVEQAHVEGDPQRAQFYSGYIQGLFHLLAPISTRDTFEKLGGLVAHLERLRSDVD